MKRLFAISIVIFCTGCATASYWTNELAVGMHRDNVIEVLGEPEFSSLNKKREVLVFRLTPQGSLVSTEEYWVVIDDGVVSAYGRPTDM